MAQRVGGKRGLRLRAEFLIGITCGLALAPRAWADALVGDVGAAYSTPEAAEDNPANAAFLDQTQFFYAAEMYKNETINVRYPSFDPTTLSTSGLSAPLDKPSLIFKLTPRLAVGGFIIPPLPVTISIKKSRIPAVLVGTQTYVDLAVNAKENGIGVATLAYRISDRLGIGIGADYQALSLNATLTPSGSGKVLATIDGSILQMDLILGIRFDMIPGRVQFGVAATVASEQSQILNVSSPLIGGGSVGGAAKEGGSSASGIRPLTGGLAGVQLGLTPRAHIMLEARYTHVNQDQQGYSLVALKQEPQDLHDTVAVRAGAIVGIASFINLLGGFRYEPSSVGEGSRGSGGEVGFGTISLVQVLAGLAPLEPYYMVAAGLQFGFIPKFPHRPKGAEDSPHPYYQVTLEGGIAYTYASVGIDASGELPGAYLYRKLSIPIALGYKF